jgi:hypothetical protein
LSAWTGGVGTLPAERQFQIAFVTEYPVEAQERWGPALRSLATVSADAGDPSLERSGRAG